MKNWRVGSLTTGVILIIVGLLWFLRSFLPLPYPTLLLNTWPVVCILLGIEILSFQIVRKEESLRFHWLSIVLLVFVLFVSFTFSYLSIFYDGHISI
jgi:hypothetical protein